MDNHNIKSKSNYRQALEENTLIQRSKQTQSNNNNNNNNNNYFINIIITTQLVERSFMKGEIKYNLFACNDTKLNIQ
jgi:hypothetical protein